MAIIDLKSPQEPTYFSDQVAFARRFYRHSLDAGKTSGYRVVAGGTETCLPGYRIDRTEFPYWALEVVSSGRGSVRLGMRTWELKPGSVFAYSPGMPHRIMADDTYPLKKHFVDFVPTPDPPGSLELLTGKLNGRVVYSHSPESLRRSFDDLLEFGSRQSEGSGEICSNLVDLLLMKISSDSAEMDLAESTSYRSYRRCLEIIDQRFLEFSGVSDVAREANMDVSYLCRLFKRYGGETPYRRLTRVRMNHAAGLLVRGGMTVKQTALELGYDDAFTFSRRFKTVMGVSPREFAETVR